MDKNDNNCPNFEREYSLHPGKLQIISGELLEHIALCEDCKKEAKEKGIIE